MSSRSARYLQLSYMDYMNVVSGLQNVVNQPVKGFFAVLLKVYGNDNASVHCQNAKVQDCSGEVGTS